ncbi:PH domain-containing protein [Citricoccus nitrophenolicus]|uniref:PH domain-containing protein n=1 Tax=Citricoccus nitrophenolicus TaxID=863575 RepID=A0ABV0IFQ5_9MICC
MPGLPARTTHDVRGLEDVEWTPVSPKLIPAHYLVTVITVGIVTAVLSVPLILMLTGVWPAYPAWLAWALPAVMLAWGVLEMILVPRRVRAMGYAERDDDFLFKSGLWFRRVLAVPYGRLQYLDVKEGPVQRRFGIRSLELQTASASTNATIEGIPVEDSERLRDALMARGQARLAGL